MKNARATSDTCRQEASHHFLVKGSVDRVFGLLDPVSERLWVDDWDPTPVYPAELSRDAGSVFTLERDGHLAVWTVLAHSPIERVAEYLVSEHQYQHRWIRLRCDHEDAATTRVSVSYTTTALTAEGQRDLGRYGEQFLRAWQEPIQNAIYKLAG